jgi:hypothetical protein
MLEVGWNRETIVPTLTIVLWLMWGFFMVLSSQKKGICHNERKNECARYYFDVTKVLG